MYIQCTTKIEYVIYNDLVSYTNNTDETNPKKKKKKNEMPTCNDLSQQVGLWASVFRLLITKTLLFPDLHADIQKNYFYKDIVIFNLVNCLGFCSVISLRL